MAVDVIASLLYRLEELERRTANRDRVGTVKSVDYDKRLVVMEDGTGWESDALMWRGHCGGNVNIGDLPSIGQQVMLRAFGSGMQEDGIIEHFGPTDDHPAPATPNGEYVVNRKGITTTYADAKHETTFGKSAVAVKEKSVRVSVQSIDQFKIKIGGSTFQLKMDALLPTGDDSAGDA